MISAPLCGVYVLSMLLNRLSQCPETAFAIDTATFSLPLVCGVAVFFLSSFVFLASLGGVFIEGASPRSGMSDWLGGSFRALAFASALFGLSASAMLWLTVRQSYNCIMPDSFLLRASPFVSAQRLPWDDIHTVQTMCWMSKNGPTGGLQFSLSNGTAIDLQVWNATRKTLEPVYGPVKAALAGKHYAFMAVPDTGKNLCPPALYRLFSEWRDEEQDMDSGHRSG